MEKVEFILRVVKLNPKTRFLYYYNGYPSKSWYNYHEIIQKYPNLFKVNKQMLRTGIIGESFEEMRLDIDTKLNGKKSLNESIKTTEIICKILDKNYIKYSLYYSGGSGMHFHILYNNSEFKEFENQKKVRELICEHLGFLEKIDKQLLSNEQQMTCEGYSKRKSIDNSKKIYIGEEGKKNIKEYIEENKFKTLVNFNYFNEINTFSKEIIEYVKQNYKSSKSQKQVNSESKKDEFISAEINISKIERKGFVKPSEKIIIRHLITYSKLYYSKCKGSTNNFYTIVCTYLYSSTCDYEKALFYFNMLFNKFKCPDNLTCSREQKLKSIIENYNKGKKKIFINNPYFTKEEFWNEYYLLFPKNNNSVAKSW